MDYQAYEYTVVGGGLAAGSAVKAIREQDESGRILMISSEEFLPYDRPPLSKKLWFGKKTVDEIFVNSDDFYSASHVDVLLETEVVSLDAGKRVITTGSGTEFTYTNLLLATGGRPRKLDIPGGDLAGIYYYRYLRDYVSLEEKIAKGASVLVIGGGFIGSEMAAALRGKGAPVTILFPDDRILQRVFPGGLSLAVEEDFRKRGVAIINHDSPASFKMDDAGKITTTTKGEAVIVSDVVVVGIGIAPNTQLAESAELLIENGVRVDRKLRASADGIFAAGDAANFPYGGAQEFRRVEHWDNALNQGRVAGLNMAGKNLDYDYMPYFFSDLFDFGYEAVGDLDSSLDIFADWKLENNTGVLYYLKDKRVRGIMTCNIYDKMDDARKVIQNGTHMSPDDLKGAISWG